jgi:Bacterial TSP3 repeat
VSGSIFLGYENDFPSPLTVSNGTVSCQRLVVSDFVSQFVPRTGRGTLTMAGGTVRVSSELDVGDCLSKRTGAVFITGGSLFVTNSAQTASIVVSGGTFTMTGGTVIADRFVMTNSCAQFVRTGGTLIYGNAILATNLDADGDGLPNGWEQAYGLDPLNAADATADNDGDGMSNLQESLTGTDPTNSSSAFRVLSVVATNDDMLVTWSCGGGRTNVVQSAPDVGGSYSNVSPNVVLSGSGDVTTNYLDVGAATNAGSRFYRIRLVP